MKPFRPPGLPPFEASLLTWCVFSPLSMMRRRRTLLSLHREAECAPARIRSTSSSSSEEDPQAKEHYFSPRLSPTHSRTTIVVCILFPTLFILMHIQPITFIHWSKPHKTYPSVAYFHPSDPHFTTSNGDGVVMHPKIAFDHEGADYGGLEIRSLLQASYFERRIHHSEPKWYEEERESILDLMDDWNIQHGGKVRDYYDEKNEPVECAPLKWHDMKHQVCNNLHEQHFNLSNDTAPELQYEMKTLGQGYYRLGLLLRPTAVEGPGLVMKMLHFYRPLNQRQFIKVNNEALMMERLTGSPQVTNTYGHCGSSILVEEASDLAGRIIRPDPDKTWRGFIPQEDLEEMEKENDGYVQFNSLEPEEKLDIAISMAESIALLHGNPEGVVVYDDIWVDQWMLAADGRVILNDLNSVVPLAWNRTSQNYCTFQSRSGNFKPPEYYNYAGQMTEQSDIVPMGHMIYVLLTGLVPYYNETSYDEIDQWVQDGNLPLLNPKLRSRTLIERGMAGVMDRCLEFLPDDRPSIFDVVHELRWVRDQHNMRLRGGKGNLIKYRLANRS